MSSTATAAGATSSTDMRIDSYIAARFKEANSADFSTLKSSAEALRRHGFTSSANSRYAAFLEAFRSAPDLAASYAERYPSCCFLPWPALHSLMDTLQLWCDLPEHYTGAIPPEQLPWLDLFALDSADSVPVGQICDLARIQDPKRRENLLLALMAYTVSQNRRQINSAGYHPSQGPQEYESITTIDPTPYFGNDLTQRQVLALDQKFQSYVEAENHHARFAQPALWREQAAVLHQAVQSFHASFFVIAPPEAFRTTKDFPTRVRELSDRIETAPKIPPNDPLVVRFVRGGALVVAAWGDEAAELNALVSSLNI